MGRRTIALTPLRVAGCALVALLLAGCTPSEPEPTAPTVTVMPSLVEEPDHDPLLAEAEATVSGFLDDVAAMRADQLNDADLLLEFASEAYATQQTELAQEVYDDGYRVIGAPTLTNIAIEDSYNVSVDAFVVRACLDVVGIQLLDPSGVDVNVPPVSPTIANTYRLQRSSEGVLQIVEELEIESEIDPCVP